MTGGDGNDVYFVDDAGDVVNETTGLPADIDRVESDVSFVLGAGVENLDLNNNAPNGTGNDLANIINGNDAANQILGGGGNDTLNGDDGNDVIDGGLGNDIDFRRRRQRHHHRQCRQRHDRRRRRLQHPRLQCGQLRRRCHQQLRSMPVVRLQIRTRSTSAGWASRQATSTAGCSRVQRPVVTRSSPSGRMAPPRQSKARSRSMAAITLPSMITDFIAGGGPGSDDQRHRRRSDYQRKVGGRRQSMRLVETTPSTPLAATTSSTAAKVRTRSTATTATIR